MRHPRFRRPRLRREGDRWWAVALTVLALLGSLVALAGLVLHAVATPWRPVIVLASFAHFLMWTAPVALLVAVLARRWGTGAVAAALTVLVLLVQLPARIASGAPAGGTRVTVLQANLRLGNADPGPIVTLVRRNHVELLATEELTTPEITRLVRAGLSAQLPYHYLAPLPSGGGGLGIWSRYPLADTQNLPHFWLGVLTARVTLPTGASVTFGAVHLTPPYPYSATRWKDEIARLRDLMPGLGTPTLLAGDYNSTTDHAQFRDLLAHGYADAAGQAGAGYLPSYPNDAWYGPVIAIDHVLTHGAVATSAQTVDLPNSDHRGLLVHVALGG